MTRRFLTGPRIVLRRQTGGPCAIRFNLSFQYEDDSINIEFTLLPCRDVIRLMLAQQIRTIRDNLMKRLNWKFLLVLVVLAAVLGVGSFAVYKFRRARSVAKLLVQAKAAEKAGDRAKADGLYAHYLGFRPDDSATMADYGLMLATGADTPAARAKALGVLEQVLRLDPSRSDVRREIIRIAMDRTVQRYAQAREHIEACSPPRPTMANLEFQAGQCLEGERKFQEAADLYAKAVTHAPTLVEATSPLAALLRTRLANPAEADKTLDRMVELNPKSFLAYLERGNQRRLGRSKGAEEDIARALELAPGRGRTSSRPPPTWPLTRAMSMRPESGQLVA